MAENIISIATFDFDTTKIEKNLESLQGTLFELQQEQKRYSDQNKNIQKQYDELNKQQVELKKQKQQESQAYKDVTAQMRSLETQQKGVFLSQKDLAIQTGVVRSEYNSLVKVQASLIASDGALLSSQEAITNALNREVTTRAEAKRSSIEINKLKDQLNPKIKEEAKLLDALNERVNRNNTLLKETGSEREKQISNVGNYKNSIIEAANELNIFNGGLSGFIGRAQEAGGVMPLLQKGLSGVTAGIAGATRASLAFIATPIGAIIAAISLVLTPLISYLTSTQEGIDKVTAVTRPLQAIMQSLIGVLQNVGKYLFEAFSNPKETLIELADFVKNNLINRFTAFGEILEGIINLDFEQVADGVLQAGTGVEGVTGKLLEAGKQTAAFLEEAAKKGAELDRLEKSLTKTRYENTLLLGDLTEEYKKQNLITEDAAIPLKEREIAAKRSIEIAREMNLLKQKEYDIQVAILKNQQSRNDTSDAEKQELAELIAKKNEAAAQALEIETTQKTKLNSIRKAAAVDAAKIAKEQRDLEIKNLNESLDYFIATQGLRSKTLEEQLEIDKQVAEKSLEILKKELAAKNISRKQYNTEVLNIQQDLLQKQAEITIQNAELELKEYIRLNDAKYLEKQRLNDELLAQETQRLLDENLKQQEFAQLKLDQGIINKIEYDAEMLKLDKEGKDAQQKLDQDFLKQKSENEALNRKLELEAKLNEISEYEGLKFEAEQLILDQQNEESLIKLEESRANGLISEENFLLAKTNLEEKYAQQSNQIEKLKQDFKLKQASDTFGSLATILGEQSSAGKAFAVAQTTIDTYLGAQKAYTSQLIPGDPSSIVRAVIAGGSAVASGLENVKKILSTDTNKVKGNSIQGLATGGIVQGGTKITRSNGDDRLITAKTGETILTERQSSFIGNDLLSLAGVPGYATGGIVGTKSSVSKALQSNISNGSFNIDSLSSTISDAVMRGAAIGSEQGSKNGSQQGIIGLSDNRQIQQNATF